MRRISSYLVLALGLGLSATAARSDTLVVESVQASSNISKPEHGMTMDSVVGSFGEPTQRSGPVGDPPISTWSYPGFVVYFERDRVIHAVVPHH